jgi:hypothetical protein
MSTSANKQCNRHTEVVEYIDMNREQMSTDIRKTTNKGPTGELIPPCSCGAYCRMRKPATTLTIATAPFPIILNIPPRPAVNMKVMEFLRISKNPLMAAVQKFSPVRAIWQ